MAFVGYKGQNFIFQIRFLDTANLPIAVLDAVIRVFHFDPDTGDLVTLTPTVLMDPVVPVEVGRFTYIFLVPDSLADGSAVYAEMSGTDPGTGDLLEETQSFVVGVDPALLVPGLATSFF